MPFGVNSDPSFRAQKQRIRVRVSSFRTAGTVIGPGIPRDGNPGRPLEYPRDIEPPCTPLKIFRILEFENIERGNSL